MTSPIETPHLTGESGEPLEWARAWQRCQYGPDGFYRSPVMSPADHFRTSVKVGGPIVAALMDLLDRIDVTLSRPEQLDLVDVGAGRGELLTAVLEQAGDRAWYPRIRPLAIDLRPRPDDLDPRIEWRQAAAPDAVPTRLTGLLVATELLDDVPCAVVGHDGLQRRYLHVDADGNESLGEPIGPEDQTWLDRYWPDSVIGHRRAEVGASRDRLCVDLAERVTAGTALFVDYPVSSPPPDLGTLAAYRSGRLTAAVPDGSCNITANVMFQSCADAVADLGTIRLLDQVEVLAGYAEPPAHAHGIAALAWRSEFAELTDLTGLGTHRWLQVDRRWQDRVS